MKLRIFPYLLSQYLWVVILSVPLISLFSYTTKIMTDDFTSADVGNQKFNSSANPTWIMHTTDIHLSVSIKGRYEQTYKALNNAIKKLKPKKIIFTGDLVDNKTPGNAKRSHTKQIKEDWDLYQKLLNEINLTNDERLVQVAGNHDFFDILSLDSEKHYANGIIYNLSTMIVNRHKLDVDVGTASVLAINPYDAPAPVVRLTWFTTPSDKILKKIKKEIYSNDDSIQIIAEHHPVAMVFPNAGSNSCYSEIIKSSPNVRLILSGHRHPENPVFQHWGNVLEVIGTPLFKYPNRVGIVTIDNRRVAYHDVYTDKENIALMTNPVPKVQTSSLDVFEETDTEVRALYFGKKPGNLSVSGSVKGQLRCDKEIDNEVWLCSLPFSLPPGDHVIHKEGDWSGDVDFVIAKTIPSFEEVEYNKQKTIAYAILYVWANIICFFVTIPFGKSNINTAFDAWIYGRSENPNWLFALFAGFIAVRHRISKAPYIIRYALFFASIWPLVLPIALFGIEDKPAMFWAWGYVGNGKAMLGYQGTMFGLAYLYFVVVPAFLMASAISGTTVRSKAFVFDFVVYIASFYGIYYIVDDLCHWIGTPWALTSPTFIFIPIILLLLLVWYGHSIFKDSNAYNKDLFARPLI